MAVEITAVHMSGGTQHEHIETFRWASRENSDTGDSSKPTMVDWIDNQNGVAYVGSGANEVAVGVVHPTNGSAYLRTHADGQWTNNLLALPTF
jgi:hypothetical protein